MRDIYKIRYRSDRDKATNRGITFLLTFEEWRGVWDASGRFAQRGLGSDQYRMVRLDKAGPFAIGNVKIHQGSAQRTGRDVLRRAFTQQVNAAGKRGIPFLLTYEQWLEIWKSSGKLSERGVRRGQYVMARHGDKGPYAADNVRICTVGENGAEREAWMPKRGFAAPGFKLSVEKEVERARKSAMTRTGAPIFANRKPKSEHTRRLISAVATGRRKVIRDGKWAWAHPGDEDYPV